MLFFAAVFLTPVKIPDGRKTIKDKKRRKAVITNLGSVVTNR